MVFGNLGREAPIIVFIIRVYVCSSTGRQFKFFITRIVDHLCGPVMSFKMFFVGVLFRHT